MQTPAATEDEWLSRPSAYGPKLDRGAQKERLAVQAVHQDSGGMRLGNKDSYRFPSPLKRLSLVRHFFAANAVYSEARPTWLHCSSRVSQSAEFPTGSGRWHLTGRVSDVDARASIRPARRVHRIFRCGHAESLQRPGPTKHHTLALTER